jgi:hypothetical protein
MNKNNCVIWVDFKKSGWVVLLFLSRDECKLFIQQQLAQLLAQSLSFAWALSPTYHQKKREKM